MDFSTQPSLLSVMPGTLLELADPTFDGRSGFRAWVMSSLFRGLGFPQAPAAGCLEDGGPFEVATGPHITFSSCHTSRFSSVKRSHAALPPQGYLPRPPSWLSARSLLVPRPLKAGLSTGHSRLFHIWQQPVVSLSKAPEPLSPS